jgi:ethanolamine utilization protein EutS
MPQRIGVTFMDLQNQLAKADKMRIIQEIVPGKQITIAHIIANPDSIVYKKLGLNPDIDYAKAAIGIITMSPSETAIIAGDLAIKTAGVELGFIDRFSGTLIITGRLSEVEAALKAVIDYTENKLHFTVCDITRT